MGNINDMLCILGWRPDEGEVRIPIGEQWVLVDYPGDHPGEPSISGSSQGNESADNDVQSDLGCQNEGCGEPSIADPVKIVSQPQDKRNVAPQSTVELSLKATGTETLEYTWERNPDGGKVVDSACKKTMEGEAASGAIQSHIDKLCKQVTPEDVAPAFCAKGMINKREMQHATNKYHHEEDRVLALLQVLMRNVQSRPHWFHQICEIFDEADIASTQDVRDEYQRKLKEAEGWKPLPADGAKYEGVHTPTLTITSVQRSDQGSYRCIVYNDSGIETSQTAVVTVEQDENSETAPGVSDLGAADRKDSLSTIAESTSLGDLISSGDSSQVVDGPKVKEPDELSMTTQTIDKTSEEGVSASQPLVQPLNTSTCATPSDQSNDSPRPLVQPLNTSTCATPSDQGTNSPQSHTYTASELEAEPFSTQEPDPMQIENIMSRLETAFTEWNMEEVESVLAQLLGEYSPQSETPRALLVALVRRRRELPDVVKKLLALGVPTNFLLDDGRCLLHLASENRHREIVNLLLAGGRTPSDSDVNAADKQGNRPLHLACNPVQPQTGRCGYESPLQMECQDNAVGVVETLLANGADPLCVNREGNMPLHLACTAGNIRIVEKLVRRDPATLDGLDKYHNTALHLACRCSNLVGKIVHLTPPGRLNTLLRQQNLHGDAPIHLATRDNNVKSVKTLLSCKHSTPFLTGPHHGETPLHIACSQHNYEMMRELVKRCARKDRKAFLDVQNVKGETAMHIACRNGLMKTVEYLKKNGATRRLKNKANMTPADVAFQEQHMKIYRYLVKGRFGKFSRQRHRMSRIQSLDSVVTSPDSSIHSETVSLDTFYST